MVYALLKDRGARNGAGQAQRACAEYNRVYEGDSIMLAKDPTTNADLTQEYYFGQRYGMGIILAGGNSGIGRYEIA